MELFHLLGKIAIDANGAETTIDNFSSKAENMAQKIGGSLKKVGDKMSLTGTVMTASVTTPLTILGKKAFTVASNFEDAMSQAAGALNKPINQMDDLRQLALDMGESTIFSATEAGSAITELAKGGLSEAQIKGGALASTMDLAASAQMGLGDAANVVVQTMGAFRIGADDSSVAVNALAGAAAASSTDVQPLTYGLSQCAAMASNAGWEIAETTGVLGLFADAGINGSDAGTSLKTMLQRLAAPTDKAAELIDQLGIRTRDSSGNLLGASEMAEELKVKLSGLSAEQRDAALATIFGSDATRAATVLMNSGSEGLRKYVEAANDQTAANRLAESQMGNNNRAIEEMNGAIETAAITVGEKLAPHITKLANWIKDLAIKFSGLDSSTQDSIIKFVAFVAAIGPVLIVVGRVVSVIGTVISVGSKLIGGIGKVVTVGKGLLTFGSTIVTGISTVATFIGGTLIPAIASIGAPILIVIGVIGALVAAGVAVYKNWDEIKEFASGCWDGIKNVVGGAVEGIKGFFSSMGEKFGELKDNMTEKATQLKDNVSDKFHELKEKGVEKFTELRDKATEKFTELKDKASEKISELKEKATSKITELKDKTVEKLTEMRDKAVEKVGELKDNAVSRLSDLKDKLGSHVQAAKDKVITGFTQLKDGASEKLTEFKRVGDEKIDAFKESAVKKFSAFKDEAAAKITQLKDTGAQKLAELAQKGIAGFQDIRDKGNSAIDNLKSAVGQKFGEMGSTIMEKFTAVGTSIRTVFDNVKNAVSNIVENIKSLFNFEWKLPKIKLPEFKLDGEFNLGPLTLPKIGVEWHAKGGVMTQPTAFGFNPLTNKIMGGGEAGPEAIAPISVLQDYIRTAVSEKNEELIQILNALYGLLNTYLPLLSKMDLVMDTGEMVGALAVPMNQAIGSIARREERIR